MKPSSFLLLLLLCCTSKAVAQQQIIEATDSSWIFIFDEGPATHYPAEIAVSGAYEYLVQVVVGFPFLYMDGNYNELDLMLESPSGKRVMLMSDINGNGTVAASGFSSSANIDLLQSGYDYQHYYQPYNFGTEPDSFPSPGPGVIQPSVSTFANLINDDPNGIWRLWLVDDDPSGSLFSLQFGWSLRLVTSPTPVCLNTDVPQVSGVTDTTALLTWLGNGSATTWDIVIGGDSLPVPSDSTMPTFAAWPNDSLVVTGLLPGEPYQFYVRSACANGDKSLWVGPVSFTTLYTPCLHAVPIELCQFVNVDTVRYFSGFMVQTACGTSPHRVFSFTPPETGAYWLEFEFFGSGSYATCYWLPDTSAICPSDGWKCRSHYSPITASNFMLDTLMAGVSYFLMFEQMPSNVFRLSRCPVTNVQIEQNFNTPLEPFTGSIKFTGIPNDTTSMFDLLFTADTAFVPDANTPPVESGVVVNPFDDQGIYHLTTDTLTPSTQYRMWLRVSCEAGAANTCWTGPFLFQTGTFCGTFDSVWFDNVTENSARLNFLSPSFSIIDGELWEAPHAQYAGNIGQTQADSAGMLIQKTLTGLQPGTMYEIYLNAFCWPSGGNNPFYGPFTFSTLPGCFLPFQDIECEQIVQGHWFRPDSLNVFERAICEGNWWEWFNVNEVLYRITAQQTGNLYVSRTGSYLNDQLHWFYKDVSLGCDTVGLISAGCWQFPNSMVSFPVEEGHTYYLLADGNLSTQFLQESELGFKVTGCAPKCPMVDSIWLDAKTATSASLRWRNVAPGATYEVNCRPDNLGPEKMVSTTDSTIVVDGLIASELYTFSVRTYCPGGEPTDSWLVNYQLGDHELIKESVFSRCNPRFLPPGGTSLANYDVLKLEVPEDGDYRLISFHAETYLYDGQFAPEAPATNLLAAVTVAGTDNRMDSLLSLQTGKVYDWVIAAPQNVPNLPLFNPDMNNLQKVLADGPAIPQVGDAQWNGLAPSPTGIVPGQINNYHSGTCRDTAGWVHFYSYNPNAGAVENDFLLLSIETESSAAVLNSLPMLLYNDPPAAVLLQNPPTAFVQNPDGFYEMNRFWLMEDLLPSQQIDEDFKVRFYYTQTDYELMKEAIELAGGLLDSHEAMYFHKINGFHGYFNVAPEYGHPFVPAATAYDSVGYWTYANGPEATTTTWRHGQFAGEHYAEMVIHGFSGGGGGASVNGNSVFDPVSKTTEANGITGLKLMPNPNRGYFTVELPMPASSELRIRILDFAGRLCLEITTDINTRYQTIEAGSLPAGMYFLQVVAGERVLAAEKFVRE